MYRESYRGKTVLITGNTGFKGTWLSIYLNLLGAHVIGYSLDAPTVPSVFEMTAIGRQIEQIYGNVLDRDHLLRTLMEKKPDFIFHLAAQSLVLESYAQPYETFEANFMGSLAVMESIRAARRPVTVIMVTSDKCYENNEWAYGYRESDPMGGKDAYSASKGATEIAIASYRRSFFPPEYDAEHGVRLASTRAGNVIGGGDWAQNRIIPDIIRSLKAGEAIKVRNPTALRPWQHVLEPLSGYLWLGALLAQKNNQHLAEGWNFGPLPMNSASVQALTEATIRHWGSGTWIEVGDPKAPHEAQLLRLSIDKAIAYLGWQPVWDFETSVARTIDWYRQAEEAGPPEVNYQLCVNDIEAFNAVVRDKHLAWGQ